MEPEKNGITEIETGRLLTLIFKDGSSIRGKVPLPFGVEKNGKVEHYPMGPNNYLAFIKEDYVALYPDIFKGLERETILKEMPEGYEEIAHENVDSFFYDSHFIPRG